MKKFIIIGVIVIVVVVAAILIVKKMKKSSVENPPVTDGGKTDAGASNPVILPTGAGASNSVILPTGAGGGSGERIDAGAGAGSGAGGEYTKEGMTKDIWDSIPNDERYPLIQKWGEQAVQDAKGYWILWRFMTVNERNAWSAAHYGKG